MVRHVMTHYLRCIILLHAHKALYKHKVKCLTINRGLKIAVNLLNFFFSIILNVWKTTHLFSNELMTPKYENNSTSFLTTKMRCS